MYTKHAVEIEVMNATAEKLRAEARKLNREYGLAPMLAGASMMAAATGLALVLLKAFGV